MSKQRMEQNWQRMKAQILSVWGDLGDIDEQELKKARAEKWRKLCETYKPARARSAAE